MGAMRSPTFSRRTFLQRAVGLAAAAAVPGQFRAAPGRGGTLLAYVGTYSSPPLPPPPGKVDLPPGNGRGIHWFHVDRVTGALTAAGVFEQPTSPSGLAVNAAGTRMYSTNATDQFTGSDSGSISAFEIDRADGRLTLLNTVASGGAGPTYASVHPSGRFLLVANYAGGTVAVLPIRPNGRWFYSLQEEASTIALFDYDPTGGRLTMRQTVSSLPPGFAGSSFASEIMVSPDGRFVYAANRLHDSIAFFAVGETGTLRFVGEEWTRGDYPRSFNFDPTGRFLYSCNQRSDAVTAFRVDRESGRLDFTGLYTPVGNPSIIVFVDLAAG